MPEPVVQPFEAVQVDVQNAERQAVGPVLHQRTAQLLQQVTPIGQGGQFIMQGHMTRAALSSPDTLQVRFGLLQCALGVLISVLHLLPLCGFALQGLVHLVQRCHTLAHAEIWNCLE